MMMHGLTNPKLGKWFEAWQEGVRKQDGGQYSRWFGLISLINISNFL
jgi:hypothetical protein